MRNITEMSNRILLSRFAITLNNQDAKALLIAVRSLERK